MSEVTIREAAVQDAATVAMLFSEFNALLGADGLHEEAAFAPENVNVGSEQMARRLTAMEGVETTLLAETYDGPSLQSVRPGPGSPEHGRRVEGRGTPDAASVAGLCCLRLIPYIGQDAPYAEVTQLYVRDAYKRRGVGAALLREAERRAIAAGATCVHIITGRDNLDAQAFYRAQGYASETVVFDKYFESATSVGPQHAGVLRMATRRVDHREVGRQ